MNEEVVEGSTSRDDDERDVQKRVLPSDVGNIRNLPNKFLKVGDREIERGQMMTAFALKNSRILADIKFNYQGHETFHVMSAISPVACALGKLVVHGNFDVSDELLRAVADSCPSIRSVKLLVDNPDQNLVTSAGLSSFVAIAPLLCKFTLFHCSLPTELELSSQSLEKISIWGLWNCHTVRLLLPNCRNLVLELFKAPLQGLTNSVSRMSKLESLCVLHPFTVAGIREMQLENMESLSALSLQDLIMTPAEMLHTLAGVLKRLTVLELKLKSFDDDFVTELARLCPNLQRMQFDGGVSADGIRNFIQTCTSLQSLMVSTNVASFLSVMSYSLRSLCLQNCKALSRLEIYCPLLEELLISGCPLDRDAIIISQASEACRVLLE